MRERNMGKNKIKTYDFEELLKKQLKDREFRREYDELDGEFALAGEIMRLRLAKNMTQSELAKIAGTSQSAIARVESGRYSNISMSFLRKIGEALGTVPEIHFRKAE
jgi:DNA-binding XRE family transcriptional regulator